MKAIRLQTEYLHNPIGIDFKKSRLFWNCENGEKQTAYQVIAEDGNNNILWDTGKILDDSMKVIWEGKPLKSRTKVIWKVLLWDESDDEGEWSENAHFELGLESRDWEASWITGDFKPQKNKRYPIDCFRKAFTVKDVKSARLYITACGLYEACINGRKIGDFVLAPGITDYRLRIQYQTYDVTDLLQPGMNIITVQLADGWFRGSVGAWGLRNQYGKETKFIAQLELTNLQDNINNVLTDDTWEWSNDGPIRLADNKDGELVDARRIPSYNSYSRVTSNHIIPTASNNVSITEHEYFNPEIITTPSGNTVLDFGQNIAGYIQFQVNAKEGQKVSLRFGEILDRDGEFTQDNFILKTKIKTTPLQKIKYICKEGINRYKTTFSIFGYRYVLLKTDTQWSPEDFKAIAVYSDVIETGKFSSSNPLLDKFVENTIWSAKSNMADIPTDCPTRERHGWTGDAQIFTDTACYLFNYAPFASKYIRDMYDWQKPNGCLPQIVPYGGVDFYMGVMNGSVGWADAGVLIPYRCWKQYNDKQFLQEHYDGMACYARFMQERCGKWYPTSKATGLKGEDKKYVSNYGQIYGEWAEPANIYMTTWKDIARPNPEVATAYTSYIMECMEEIALALDKEVDAQDYRNWANKTRKAYQALRRQEGYTLDTDRQATIVRPLAFDLLDEVQKSYAENRLIKALDNYNWRIGTGFLSTPLILDVLADIDIEYAYKLLENEEMPGWLFMPKNGSTTVWEAWEGTEAQDGIGSLNHYSKGAVCQWLFRVMCGINVGNENEFIIKPKPGGSFTYASAEYNSLYGKVTSGWSKKANGEIKYIITVPANCRAKIELPGNFNILQNPGIKTYVVKEERLYEI